MKNQRLKDGLIGAVLMAVALLGAQLLVSDPKPQTRLTAPKELLAEVLPKDVGYTTQLWLERDSDAHYKLLYKQYRDQQYGIRSVPVSVE